MRSSPYGFPNYAALSPCFFVFFVFVCVFLCFFVLFCVFCSLEFHSNSQPSVAIMIVFDIDDH